MSDIFNRCFILHGLRIGKKKLFFCGKVMPTALLRHQSEKLRIRDRKKPYEAEIKDAS